MDSAFSFHRRPTAVDDTRARNANVSLAKLGGNVIGGQRGSRVNELQRKPIAKLAHNEDSLAFGAAQYRRIG